MNKVIVLYFSGTGMSEYVVKKVVENFDNKSVEIATYSIENKELHNIAFSDVDRIGIIYPVHSFNSPEILIKKINELNFTALKCFIIGVAGDENVCNNSSSQFLIKTLKDKSNEVVYNKIIQMPSNFILKHGDEEVEKIIKKVNIIIPSIVDDIVNEEKYFQPATFSTKLLSNIGRLEWVGAKYLGKSFYADENCINCLKCMKRCPTNNIYLNGINISFSNKCCLCMRCVYNCPTYAIKIKKPFSFILLDKWYDSSFFK